jgi:hypothetical protein
MTLVKSESDLWIRQLMVMFLFMVFACVPAMAKDLALNASIRDRVLIFSIKNDTDHDVRINRSFSMDPILGSIRLEVRRHGSLLHVKGHIDGDMPDNTSYVTIYPGQFYGGSMDMDLLKKLYGMSRGCYSLRIFYRDKFALKFDAYPGEISSDSIYVCMRHGAKN